MLLPLEQGGCWEARVRFSMACRGVPKSERWVVCGLPCFRCLLGKGVACVVVGKGTTATLCPTGIRGDGAPRLKQTTHNTR